MIFVAVRIYFGSENGLLNGLLEGELEVTRTLKPCFTPINPIYLTKMIVIATILPIQSTILASFQAQNSLQRLFVGTSLTRANNYEASKNDSRF